MEKKKNGSRDLEETDIDKPPLDLDTILVEEIGQFGLYQVKSMLLAIVVVIFAAWVASEYVFSTARINTR